MTGDIVLAVVVCGALVLWFVSSRQSVLDRVEQAERARSALERRPDDTPTLLKARIWKGRR